MLRLGCQLQELYVFELQTKKYWKKIFLVYLDNLLNKPINIHQNFILSKQTFHVCKMINYKYINQRNNWERSNTIKNTTEALKECHLGICSISISSLRNNN